MQYGEGLISKILAWLWHPSNDDSTTLQDWGAGLVVVMLMIFAWSTVVKMIE
jgi:hypothetical protein